MDIEHRPIRFSESTLIDGAGSLDFAYNFYPADPRSKLYLYQTCLFLGVF